MHQFQVPKTEESTRTKQWWEIGTPATSGTRHYCHDDELHNNASPINENVSTVTIRRGDTQNSCSILFTSESGGSILERATHRFQHTTTPMAARRDNRDTRNLSRQIKRPQRRTCIAPPHAGLIHALTCNLSCFIWVPFNKIMSPGLILSPLN